MAAVNEAQATKESGLWRGKPKTPLVVHYWWTVGVDGCVRERESLPLKLRGRLCQLQSIYRLWGLITVRNALLAHSRHLQVVIDNDITPAFFLWFQPNVSALVKVFILAHFLIVDNDLEIYLFCLFVMNTTTCKVTSCLLHVCFPVCHSIINLAPLSPPQ